GFPCFRSQLVHAFELLQLIHVVHAASFQKRDAWNTAKDLRAITPSACLRRRLPATRSPWPLLSFSWNDTQCNALACDDLGTMHRAAIGAASPLSLLLIRVSRS